MTRNRLLSLIAVVVAVAVAGFALFGPPQEWARERMTESTAVEKSASVGRFKKGNPNAEELLRAAARKTELLFGDCKAVVVSEIPGGGISMVPEKDSGECKNVAAVVPVASDGYFLTAAHAIGGSSQVIVVITNDSDRMRAHTASARVVWISPDRGIHPDLAVLHAEVGLIEPFEVAETPAPEDVVIQTGSGVREQTSVGRVLAVSKTIEGRNGSMYQLVRHDAPSMKGDSGGALADLRGHLIGINADIHPPAWLAWLPYVGSRISNLTGGVGSYSQAVRPNPDWLADLIAADRERVAAE